MVYRIWTANANKINALSHTFQRDLKTFPSSEGQPYLEIPPARFLGGDHIPLLSSEAGLSQTPIPGESYLVQHFLFLCQIFLSLLVLVGGSIPDSSIVAAWRFSSEFLGMVFSDPSGGGHWCSPFSSKWLKGLHVAERSNKPKGDSEFQADGHIDLCMWLDYTCVPRVKPQSLVLLTFVPYIIKPQLQVSFRKHTWTVSSCGV